MLPRTRRWSRLSFTAKAVSFAAALTLFAVAGLAVLVTTG